MPSIQRTDSFLYLRSPRELMRMAGSLPRLPQRLMVRVETRRSWATSETVRRSGRLLRSKSFLTGLLIGVRFWLSMSDIEISRKIIVSQWSDIRACSLRRT